MQGVHVLAIERRVVDPAPPFSSWLTCQTNKVLLGISYILKILLEVKKKKKWLISEFFSAEMVVNGGSGSGNQEGSWGLDPAVTDTSQEKIWNLVGHKITWVSGPNTDCVAWGAEELMVKNLHYW